MRKSVMADVAEKSFILPKIWAKCFGIGIQDICKVSVRDSSHGGGGSQVVEVPRLGGVTNLSIQSLFFFLTAFT